MGHTRLNHLMLVHVHSHVTETLSPAILNEFVKR